ncbi:beta-lactamase-like protein [Xylaria acuta]|nr:beta-lactamase-like protein [Xylaria acuta]
MATPLDLHIPLSASIVNVSIINTGATIKGLRTSMFVEPGILGHEYLATPCFSFLIQHPNQDRTLVFDLGLKKDWENWPKPLYENIKEWGATPVVPKDVHELLNEHGVDTKSIEGVVWSHSHFDHVGDMSAFEPHTKIIVGTGAKERFFPGYPTKKAASFNESDVAGHEVEEIDFDSSFLRIGGLPAVDYFADGSFYLLDTPGHDFGHMCGLARVTNNPDSFILMGGDAIHQGGELRPHPWHPLPEYILPDPFIPTSHTTCLCQIFDKLLPNGREAPFYHPSRKPNSVHADVHKMAETIKRLQEFDAHDHILLVPAHDVAFLNIAEFFPNTANTFMEKGWVEKARWAWLAEFAKAVGKDENIPRELFEDARPISTEVS